MELGTSKMFKLHPITNRKVVVRSRVSGARPTGDAFSLSKRAMVRRCSVLAKVFKFTSGEFQASFAAF
jgi:hypothetical protein